MAGALSVAGGGRATKVARATESVSKSEILPISIHNSKFTIRFFAKLRMTRGTKRLRVLQPKAILPTTENSKTRPYGGVQNDPPNGGWIEKTAPSN